MATGVVAAGTLSLRIVKGPSKGEIMDCRNVRNVSIGRLESANTICIRHDPSVSPRHLLIHLSADSQWLITSLSTSSFLNYAPLHPSETRPLRHGDVVKVGVDTLIRTFIFNPRPTRRPARRRDLAKALALTLPSLRSAPPQPPVCHRKRKRAAGESAKEDRSLAQVEITLPSRCRKRKRVDECAAQDRGHLQAAVANSLTANAFVFQGKTAKPFHMITMREWLDLTECKVPSLVHAAASRIISSIPSDSLRFDAHLFLHGITA